ncbi:MAG: VCBS repeat-containing protein, partial [Myxococcota bacterium]
MVRLVGRLTLAGLLLSALAYGGYRWALWSVGISELSVGAGLALQWLGASPNVAPRHVSVTEEDPTQLVLDEAIVPFEEIGETLGGHADSDHIFIYRGAVVFDANGDGWPDLYVPQDGRPTAKATDDGVLSDQFVPARPASLLVNLGPDERGHPRFEALQDRVRANDTYVREELLIEEKYRPRRSASDDPSGPGRIGVGAVAADFDGDGRRDLYVLNLHRGVPFQTDQLGMRVYPARENLGRDARVDAFVNRVPSFVWTDRTDGQDVTLTLGDAPEAEGRNTLYRNLGDRDGDGLPEWEDITEAAGVGGRWSSTGAAVVDFDRDGDLDLYVANFADPDFWGFGDTHFGGHPNQLYVNQLVETGQLGFVDRAEALAVSGLHREEGLPTGPYVPGEEAVRYASHHV